MIVDKSIKYYNIYKSKKKNIKKIKNNQLDIKKMCV